MNKINDIKELGYYHLRTPLYPIDKAIELFNKSKNEMVKHIKEELRKPFFKEVIRVASPSLFSEIDNFISREEIDEKQLYSFIAYYIRLSSRCTPFGVSAGTSVGRIGSRNEITFEPIENYKRHARVDLDILWNLSTKITRDPNIRTSLIFFPNNTLFMNGDRLSYVKYELDGGDRKFEYISVENNEYINEIIKASTKGASIRNLIETLAFYDIEYEQAFGFINTLIENQILVSDLEPNITGENQLVNFIRKLEKYPPLLSVRNCLEKILPPLNTLTSTPVGENLNAYDKIKDELSALGYEYKLSLPFQVDMVKPSMKNSINKKVLDEVHKTITFLTKYKSKVLNERIEKFKSAFNDRYGDKEIPILEALDPEIGLGYPLGKNNETYHSPIIEGIQVGLKADESKPFPAWEIQALQKYSEIISSGDKVVRLTDKDIEGKIEASLPNSTLFSGFTIIAESEKDIEEGNFTIQFKYAAGPSGANLMTRFCHADRELQEEVLKLIELEDKVDPEVILAEIIHVSGEGVGNITQRPVLRKYEIPILTRAGVEEEYVITLDDLYLSVVDNKCVLRSKRLNKIVKPRLTSAHEYSVNSIIYYYFLADVHYEDVTIGLYWNWGPHLGTFNFLPRVTYGKSVLSLARWSLTYEGLGLSENEIIDDSSMVEKISRFCNKNEIPKYITISNGSDNTLLLDLDNPVCLRILLSRFRKYGYLFLEEFLLNSNHQFVNSIEGSFNNEFIVPYINDVKRQTALSPYFSKIVSESNEKYTTTSDWLYVKIFSGVKVSDFLLEEMVKPLIAELEEAGLIKKWFYLRHNIPDLHLRLRFQGDEGFSFHVMKLFEKRLQKYIREKLVWHVEYHPYVPEIERYGGNENMKSAEFVFYYDSVCALKVLSLLDVKVEESELYRSLFAMKSVDRFLDDCGLNLETKRDFMAACSEEFFEEFNANKNTKKQLSEKFRNYRLSIEELFLAETEKHSKYEEFYQILNERTEKIKAIIMEMVYRQKEVGLNYSYLIPSFVHMIMNRLMMSNPRYHEMVIYDLLCQYYKSTLAKNKKGSSQNLKFPIEA